MRLLAVCALGFVGACSRGSSSPDAGVDASAIDGPPPDALPAAGSIHASYVVVAQLTFDDAAMAQGLPREHRFTLRLDQPNETAAVTALAGSGLSVGSAALLRSGSELRSVLDSSLAMGWNPGREACSRATGVQYHSLTLTPTATRLTGTARGGVVVQDGDVSYSVAFSATLTGMPDGDAPVLTVQSLGPGGNQHPFDPVFVTASEPLSSTLELRVQGAGVSSVLGSYELFAARATFYTVTNPKPLPWATSLSVDVGPALTDLAGNRGLSPPTFATYADPGVQPLDGFEGAPDNALLLGNARFVGPADSPGAIAGQRSLLVGPELRGQRPPGRATFRVVVPAGMQPRKLRATVRTVADAQGFTGWAGVIMVFAGGAFREGGITFPQAAHTTSSAPFVSDPLDYSADLGATGAPAGTDVIVDVRSTYVYCGGPLPPPNALLVDDVRFE